MAELLSVSCLLVMGCSNVVRCQLAEHRLKEMGFECQPMTEGAGSCMKTFARKHTTGPVNAVIDETCAALEKAIPRECHDWRAFVQVRDSSTDSDAAWATVQAGKSPIRGTLSLPRRRRR
jgi:hypothetical protein